MNQSPYNDPTYTINLNPAWKQPPVAEDGPVRRPLSPRAKTGIAVAAAALVGVGMFSWSQYEQAQVAAHVHEQQIALDNARLDLARQQQAAAQAKAAGQETPAQKARRLAVMACVSKAGTDYGAVKDCGQIYPVTDSPALADTSSQAAGSNGSSSGSDVGTAALVAIGGVMVVGYVKKRIPSRRSS